MPATPTSSLRERADYRINVRFGDAVLAAGHTAVPNLVLNRYARLGIAPGELLFVIHAWQYWWTERDPYPSLGTIAERMGVSRRQARNYVSALKAKRLLRVHERKEALRGQLTSEYDFEPLLEAVRNLAEGDPGKDPSEGGRKSVSADRDPVQEDEEKDSRSARAHEARIEPRTAPSRPRASTSLLRTNSGISHSSEPRTMTALKTILEERIGSSPAAAAATVTSGEPGTRHAPGPRHEQLRVVVTEVSSAVGDLQNLEVNLSRVRNLGLRQGVREADLAALLYRALSLFKERVRDGVSPVRNGGAYFFSIVDDLVAKPGARDRVQDALGQAYRDPGQVDVPPARKRSENRHSARAATQSG